MRLITRVLALIGGLTLLLFVLLLLAGGMALRHAGRPPALAAANVLRLDLDQPVTEASSGALDFLSPQALSLDHIHRALNHALSDPRIKGVVIRLGNNSLGLAQSEDLRATILSLRHQGKFVYAFGDSYGDLGGGTRPYYLAAACDQVWLQPGGTLALTGVGAEIPFFRGALDKLGVVPEFARRGQFKTAATQFTDTALPATDRAAYQGLLQSLYASLSTGIASGRAIDPAAIDQLVNNGPYTADEASDAHLIDHQGYWDELQGVALAKAGKGSAMIDLDDYDNVISHGTPNLGGSADGIALINAIGEIKSGDGDGSGGGTVYADRLAAAIGKAADNPHVKAILLRINSPGGSESASETIWHAEQMARGRGKKLVVYMSDTAASGGYYIAAPADLIIAEPMTVTGCLAGNSRLPGWRRSSG